MDKPCLQPQVVPGFPFCGPANFVSVVSGDMFILVFIAKILEKQTHLKSKSGKHAYITLFRVLFSCKWNLNDFVLRKKKK